MTLKQSYLSIIVWFFILFCTNCSSPNKKTGSNIINLKDTIITVIKDTVFIFENQTISDDFYFSIRKISNGDNFEKKDDLDYYYYYRLLFTSIEESFYLYTEEIKIVADSKYKLIKRTKVSPKIFGLDDFGLGSFDYHPELIDWISPTVVKLLINEKEYNIDLSKMKVVK